LNYLAHAYLSFGDPKVLVGNFIGDFVRDPIETVYEREIVNGIRLHREIDRFTDRHPVVKEAQSILKPDYGRYASVITDMYFDYFLCKYWNNYHHQPVELFAQETYETLESFKEILPAKFLKVFGNLRNYNFLAGYGDLEFLQSALAGMAKRTKFDSKMETAHIFLKENHEFFRIHFGIFFDDLVQFSQITLNELRERK
jgi:acyl carrier protein phosphodiesterase